MDELPPVDNPPRRRRRWGRRLLLIALVAAVVILVGRFWLGGPAVPEGSYVLLTLENDYPEEPPDDLIGRFIRSGSMPLIELIGLIRDARKDPRVAGMVVRIRPLQIGWAKAQDVRDALAEFRASGKTLIAYLEQEFTQCALEYYIASAAEKIYLPPGGGAPLNGLAAQYVFLGGVWEKLDIEMQVEKIREYKTAGDMIAAKEMSPYHREMANSLLDSVFAQLVEVIAQARDLSPDAVETAIDRSPSTPEEFASLRLADGAKFLDELRRELVGADREFVPAEDYRQAAPLERAKRKIAVVYGVGAITVGESGGSVWAEQAMGSDTITEAFRLAAADKDADAIVFRIDSPGGSALASDLIWRATQDARAMKPVVVSMSDVAASGGYYSAAGASRIVAQPATLTGSIGVVMVKPNVAGFLARLGVNTTTLARGKLARMLSFTTSVTEAERARLLSSINYIYDTFLTRVADGRHLSREQVDEVGRGRVWTGQQAQSVGLVDELGGFTAAINAAKSLVGIPEGEPVELVFYPRRRPLLERLARFLTSRTVGAAPTWWGALRASFPPLDVPDGSLLTLMPERIVIR